eukprot:751501-Hanusia_phi.AAC.1
MEEEAYKETFVITITDLGQRRTNILGEAYVFSDRSRCPRQALTHVQSNATAYDKSTVEDSYGQYGDCSGSLLRDLSILSLKKSRRYGGQVAGRNTVRAGSR